MDYPGDPTAPPKLEDTTRPWNTNDVDNNNSNDMDEEPDLPPVLHQPPPSYDELDDSALALTACTKLEHFDTILASGSMDVTIPNVSSYTFGKEVEEAKNQKLILADTTWYLLIFPDGDKTTGKVSVYLQCEETGENSKAFAHAVFSIRSSSGAEHSKDITHRFAAGTNYGYPEFISWAQLRHHGLSDNDSLTIHLDLQLLAGHDYNLFQGLADINTKRDTGMVGLGNQGATCYMNSLLQALYHTPALRRAVYKMPTENDSVETGVALALQRVFYRLQTKDMEVSTIELTKSFGWDTRDAFMQHDVQEFSRVLMDNLEEKMKGTPVADVVKQLFGGRMKSYIRCINVDYESSREEEFYDIQLNVKGIKSLEDSFEDYVKVETLEGENQYMAEGHGLQDAKKGVIFLSLPPVLHLQLKRFEYSFVYDDYYKINDRFEFPERVDLSRFLENPESMSAKYSLQAVLVHSGTTYGGHYTAFIRPDARTQWFHFDDELVYKTHADKAIEENFDSLTRRRSNGNAYMLVYVRDDVLDDVLRPVSDDEIPPQLRERFEEEERMVRERELQRQYNAQRNKFKIYTDEDFNNHQDADLIRIAPGIGSIERIHENDRPQDLILAKSEELKIPAEHLRLWLLKTGGKSRMTVAFCLDEEDLALSWRDFMLNENLKPTKEKGFTRVYVEAFTPEAKRDQEALVPQGPTPSHSEEDLQEVLIFVKIFDLQKGQLRQFRRLHAYRGTKFSQIIEVCRQYIDPMASSFELYHEKHFDQDSPGTLDIPLLDPAATVGSQNMLDGAMVILQPTIPEQEEQPSYSSVVDWFQHRCDEVVVKVGEGKHGDGESHVLRLSATLTYEDTQRAIAEAFNLDNPENIQLFSKSEGNYTPPILSTTRQSLEFMTRDAGGKLKFLNFVHLSKPVREVEQEVTLAVNWFDPEKRRMEKLTLVLHKLTTINDIIAEVARRKNVKDEDLPYLRGVKVSQGRIVRYMPADTAYDFHLDRGMLRIEVIPEDQRNLSQDDIVIEVRHVWQYSTQFHSDPFLFIFHEGELASDFRNRVKAYLRISDKEFEQWRLCICEGYSMRSIPDDWRLSADDIRPPAVLAFEHIEKNRYGRYGAEGAVKIHN
eukprot:m.147547 g.147547  ORF g.147547 m.147547 type:complete len:1113 (+) comp16116_c0_seq1:302-3640(+)